MFILYVFFLTSLFMLNIMFLQLLSMQIHVIVLGLF